MHAILATRETAFARAVTSAGVTFTLTKNCSLGLMKNCGCHKEKYKHQPTGDMSKLCSNFDFTCSLGNFRSLSSVVCTSSVVILHDLKKCITKECKKVLFRHFLVSRRNFLTVFTCIKKIDILDQIPEHFLYISDIREVLISGSPVVSHENIGVDYSNFTFTLDAPSEFQKFPCCSDLHFPSPGQYVSSLDWKWEGCSHSYHFAERVSRMYVDSRDSGMDSRALVSRHNNQAGREVWI